MRIAVTGGTGVVGRAIIEQARARGDEVVNVDRIGPPGTQDGVEHVAADITDYPALIASFAGCDAVIHMAAIPWPFQDPDHVVHNNNVVGSYNVMRAATEVGIRRICQASSVNAIGLSYSREAHFDYFPIDERHPNYAEDPYSLSKWICEQQADSLARRYDDLQIASLRFHWVVESKAIAARNFNVPDQTTARHLWGYTGREAAARACLLAVENGKFRGHEVFYIVAPDTTNNIASLELAETYYSNVPVHGDLSANRSFFSSAKAERLLEWRHD